MPIKNRKTAPRKLRTDGQLNRERILEVEDGLSFPCCPSLARVSAKFPDLAKGRRWASCFRLQDDAIAARNFRNSALFMAMKRNGCKPIGVAEQGLSSSAMASTDPICVENSSSTTAPERNGLSTRSNPPVTEMV
jgi:hypothetical protein